MNLVENNQEKTPWSGVMLQSQPKPDEKPEGVEAREEIEEVETTAQEDLLNSPETPDTTEEAVETSEEEIVDEGEEKEVNPYFYLSSKLKSDGFLLEDFEANENVSGIEVYDAYRKKLQKELEPRITQEVHNKLQNEGITSEDLLVARAIRQGVDIALLSESTMHERFASLPDKADRDNKLNSIRAMYQSRNFSQKEIDNLINLATAEEDESLDEYFTEAKTYHKQRWQDFQQKESERVAREAQQQQAQLESAEKLVNKIFSAKELFGEKLNEQESALLREAIYQPTDRVEIGGQEYTVSKLYRFNYELETNPELKLWLLKKYLLKDTDRDSIKKEVSREMEDDIMKAYETSVKKDLLAKKRKEVVQKLEKETETEKPNRKSWMVEFG